MIDFVAERVARGLRQSDLATMAGVHERTLRRIEKGQDVSTAMVDRVLRALGHETGSGADAVDAAAALERLRSTSVSRHLRLAHCRIGLWILHLIAILLVVEAASNAIRDVGNPWPLLGGGIAVWIATLCLYARIRTLGRRRSRWIEPSCSAVLDGLRNGRIHDVEQRVIDVVAYVMGREALASVRNAPRARFAVLDDEVYP